MPAKMIPATRADTPVQRMRFEVVIFILLSLMTEVSLLVFMCVSPSSVAVFVAAFILSLVALVAIVFLAFLPRSGTDTLHAIERGLER